MPRRRTRIAAAENFVRGLRGAPPLVVRKPIVVSITPAVSVETALPLSVGPRASGSAAIAGGGSISLTVTAHDVGQSVRHTVNPADDPTYVVTMAGTGALVGGVLTGGATWGEGVGFVAGWFVGVRQARRRR